MFPQALNLKISLIVFQCRAKSPQALNLAKYVYRCRGKFVQTFNLENSLILFRRRVKSSQALNLTKLRKDKNAFGLQLYILLSA